MFRRLQAVLILFYSCFAACRDCSHSFISCITHPTLPRSATALFHPTNSTSQHGGNLKLAQSTHSRWCTARFRLDARMDDDGWQSSSGHISIMSREAFFYHVPPPASNTPVSRATGNSLPCHPAGANPNINFTAFTEGMSEVPLWG